MNRFAPRRVFANQKITSLAATVSVSGLLFLSAGIAGFSIPIYQVAYCQQNYHTWHTIGALVVGGANKNNRSSALLVRCISSQFLCVRFLPGALALPHSERRAYAEYNRGGVERQLRVPSCR